MLTKRVKEAKIGTKKWRNDQGLSFPMRVLTAMPEHATCLLFFAKYKKREKERKKKVAQIFVSSCCCRGILECDFDTLVTRENT